MQVWYPLTTFQLLPFSTHQITKTYSYYPYSLQKLQKSLQDSYYKYHYRNSSTSLYCQPHSILLNMQFIPVKSIPREQCSWVPPFMQSMNVYVRRTSNESQLITPEWVYEEFFCQHKFQDICRQKESFLSHNYEH